MDETGSGPQPLVVDDDVDELERVVRRVVRARVRDPHLVDDIVQETLVRVLAQGPDVATADRRPYAIVTAINLVASTFRAEGRRARGLHRLVDLTTADLPEDELVRVDERRSMSHAIERLSERDREVLISHEVHDVPTKELAAGAGTSSGAIAVRLAAARAKLRLEYVLSHRREAPLPPRCRSVLLALSARDHRRQSALGAEEHLESCERCSRLATPLLERSRATVALAPVLAARWLGERAVSAVRRHPTTTAAGAAVVAAALVVAQATGGGPSGTEPAAPVAQAAPAPPAAPPAGSDATVRVRGVPLRAVPPDQLAGRPVSVRSGVIQAVPADEGFWLEDDAGGRIWVRLTTAAESPIGISAGTRITFDGVLVTTPEGFAATAGVDAGEGAADLAAGAVHIEVAPTAVRPG